MSGFTFPPVTTMQELLAYLNLQAVVLEAKDAPREWTPETDEYLRRYGPCATLAAVTKGLKGVTAEQVRIRATELEIPLESVPRPIPKDFQSHFTHLPSLPIDAMQRQWQDGIYIRINNPEISGVVSVLAHRSRGHSDTTDPRFKHQLVGEDMDDEYVKAVAYYREQERTRRTRERRERAAEQQNTTGN